METFKGVTLVIIPLVYLVWNILNEVNVNLFWNTEDKKYITLWHKYDSIMRIILFPLIVFAIIGLTFNAIKVIMITAILYRPMFNLGFNYWRNRDVFKELTFKQRINVLLYLSEYSIIDKYLIKINNWLYGVISRFSKWLAKVTKDKIVVRHNVKFQYFNLFLIFIEIFLVIFIIVWL